MSNQKIFLTFADTRLLHRKARIMPGMWKMGVYDAAYSADEYDLEPSFLEKFGPRIESERRFIDDRNPWYHFWKWHPQRKTRGYGYWCWKPYLILRLLKAMREGDILHYGDIDIRFNPPGRKRLLEYFAIAQKDPTGILAFFNDVQPDLSDGNRFNRYWIKGDCLDYFNLRHDDNFLHAPMVWAGNVFVRKCDRSLKLIQEWMDVFHHDFSLVDDSPSRAANRPEFIEHRHDQAIFSILCYKHSISTVSHRECLMSHTSADALRPFYF